MRSLRLVAAAVPASQRLRAVAPVGLAAAGVLGRRSLATDALATPAADKDVSTESTPVVDKATIQAFTGAPQGMLESRVVKIYQQAQGVQNATQNMIPWRMQWEDAQTQRWTNPLMGWTSTNDPLSNTHMTVEFDSAEDAARFCQDNGPRRAASRSSHRLLTSRTLPPACCADASRRRDSTTAGWKYEIVQPKPNGELHASPKKYSDNFKWKGPKGRAFPNLYKPPPPPPPKQ